MYETNTEYYCKIYAEILQIVSFAPQYSLIVRERI